MLLHRLLLTAEKIAEYTQEIKISRPIGRIFLRLSHFFQCCEALFALTNPVDGSESQQLMDLTLLAIYLIPVLEIPLQSQGQFKELCTCCRIASFHNPTISLYPWWLRDLKLCCNWKVAVRQALLEKGHDIPSPTQCALAPKAMSSTQLPPHAPPVNPGLSHWGTDPKV